MSTAPREIGEIQIYDVYGQRKYLTPGERERFKKLALTLPLPEQTFCLMLFYVGPRISEALELTFARIDQEAGTIILRTLKRRKKYVFRAYPLPHAYLRKLKGMQSTNSLHTKIWSFSRKTGYRIIKNAMGLANIIGAHASPRGLRHAFGVAGVQKKIPTSTIQKWMGHRSELTTKIYTNVVGPEERALASLLW